METEGGYECHKECGKRIKAPRTRWAREKMSWRQPYQAKNNGNIKGKKRMERPIPCAQAEESFAIKAALLSHQRRHGRLSTVSKESGGPGPVPTVPPENSASKKVRFAVEMSTGENEYPCLKGREKMSTRSGSIARHAKAFKFVGSTMTASPLKETQW